MEYKKITEVEMIEEPSENATVLAEDNGALKRVPYKNVGGGGGLPSVSAPHQMLVTDADGKTVWEDKLCGVEGVETSVILPEMLLSNLSEQNGVYMGYVYPDGGIAGLVSGNTYLVIANGIEYECKAVGEDSFVAIGNMFIMGEENVDTGEPFLIAESSQHNSCMYYSSIESLTIEISGKIELIRELPSKFLPTNDTAPYPLKKNLAPVAQSGQYSDLDGVPGAARIVTIDESGTASMSVSEIWEEIENGNMVFVRFHDEGQDDEYIVLPFVSKYSIYAVFGGYYWSNGTYGMRTVTISGTKFEKNEFNILTSLTLTNSGKYSLKVRSSTDGSTGSRYIRAYDDGTVKAE